MNKKIFIACDTNKNSVAQEIIKNTKSNKLKIGYKFGLEFLNSKKGRNFVSKLKNKIVFADLKLNDIPNTCVATVKSLKDLKLNYLTIHVLGISLIFKSAKIILFFILDMKFLPLFEFKNSKPNLYPIFNLLLFVSFIILLTLEILFVSHAIKILFLIIINFVK